MPDEKKPYQTEYLTIMIPVDLHDKVRDAAAKDAEELGRNPNRHKTTWVIEALRAKLGESAVIRNVSPGSGEAGQRG
jgi:hypothetical protein